MVSHALRAGGVTEARLKASDVAAWQLLHHQEREGAMKLSQQQIDHFRSEGWLFLPEL